MNKHVRVGDVVYDEKKNIVAIFTHGAWYREVKNNHGFELDPIEPDTASLLDRMPDALHLTMSQGELGIVQVLRDVLEKSVSSRIRNLVLEDVHRGVALGLRKHGPYDPTEETRDLAGMARGKIRNAIVYCCMRMMQLRGNEFDRSGELQDIILQLSKIWARLALL